MDLLKLDYYDRIMCSNYYRNGQLIRPDRAAEIVMLGLSELGMGAITDYEFIEGDILLYDIKLEGIPYDKLMGEVQQCEKKGTMFRMDIKFIGMPNQLFKRIKKMLKENLVEV